MEFPKSARILLVAWLCASACGDDDLGADDSGPGRRDGAVDAETRDAGSITPADAGDRPDDADADGGFVLECQARGGAVSAVHVEFRCGEITVYTCKDLSNVVIEFEDGTRQRVEGVSGHTNQFAGTGVNIGKRIVRVWVKAGNNKSGDGPGFGERVDAPPQSCTPPSGGGGRGGTGGAGNGGTGGTCVSGPDVSCVPVPTSGTGGGPAAGGGGSSGSPSEEQRPD